MWRSQFSASRRRLSKVTSETSAIPANLAWTDVSRSDQPHPTCNSSVRNNASRDGKPRNRRTAPLLLPNCRHSEGNSPRRICQSSSSVMRKDYLSLPKESILILALMGVYPCCVMVLNGLALDFVHILCREPRFRVQVVS